MGYRHTFITTDYFQNLPEEFIEKYDKAFYLPKGDDSAPIASKDCKKCYFFDDIIRDIHLLLKEKNKNGYAPSSRYAVLLGEEGDVRRIVITELGYVEDGELDRINDPWSITDGEPSWD